MTSDRTSNRIIIIDPSGQPNAESLRCNIEYLQQCGFEVCYRSYPVQSDVPRLHPEGIKLRVNLLEKALLDTDNSIILCARGGYGASDLLHKIDWQRCRMASKKILAGFSDISALQLAVFKELGWSGLHCPMPGSVLWKNGHENINQLLSLLKTWPYELNGTLQIDGNGAFETTGVLIGGCFSVICGLLGTGYMPQLDQPYILFLEDINESPQRLLRYWNQWYQAEGVSLPKAIVIGQLYADDQSVQRDLQQFPRYLQERVSCPVFYNAQIGHVIDNYPIGVGAQATIKDNRLFWKLE